MRPRKRIFVDPIVQGALIRQSLVHWLIALVILSVGLFSVQIAWDGLDKSFVHHISTFAMRYGMLLALMVCILPLLIYDSVRLSHQFSGPVYALRVALRKLAEGQSISEVAFRRGDFWAELARDVNRIADRLDQHTLTQDGDGERRDAVRVSSKVH